MRMLHMVAAGLLCAGISLAQSGFALKNRDRVVFYGDSITDQRLYTTFTESFVVTRFPSLEVTFIHSGWGGDRVTGGGGGAIDTRLPRDVFAYKPKVMTIMLGMNDASYRQLDENTFNIYKSGYEHIIESVRKNVPACRITVIEPSPFDDVTRPPQFEGGYNGVLIAYGSFVRRLGESQHLNVADLNTPVVKMLQRARDISPDQAQKIIPDRVHPAAAGHLIMAEALLKSWNAPALVSDVVIDAQTGKSQAQNANVTAVKTGGTISWTETDSALPMPLDPKDKLLALALDSSDFTEALDREMLRVTGLSAANYQLSIDGTAMGVFSSEDLAKGINLARFETPMLKQGLDVHALTLKHNNVHFARWRTLQVALENDGAPSKAEAIDALDKVDAELIRDQHSAAQPKPHHYQLTSQ